MLLVAGCAVRRTIPQGEVLLTRNRVEVDRTVEREQRITQGEISKYIKQKPSSGLFGIRNRIYAIANPDKDNWWNNFLRNTGSAPVVLDTTLTARSVQNIKNYLDTRGYIRSEEQYVLRIDSAKRKAQVTYLTRQGEPYIINSLNYDFRDKLIEQIFIYDSLSYIKPGEMFDPSALSAESEAVTDYLRNMGYYNFTVDNIHYLVDTTVGNHRADITMIVRRNIADYDDQGRAVMENNMVYRIAQINIYPDYDPTKAATDPHYNNNLDTLWYDGLNIITPRGSKFNLSMIRSIINFYPGYLYSATDVNRTYDNIMRLGYYKSAGITFSVLPKTEESYITFVTPDADRTEQTTEGYLKCDIRCTPTMKQGYTVELEASTTSSFYGLATTLGYRNRNLFGGAEQLDVSFKFGYEMLKVKGSRNSYEVGGKVGLSFPRFVAPFIVDRLNTAFNPQTRFEISINSQRRPYYHRILSTVNYGYSWGNGRHSSFLVRPVDINLVKMNYVSEEFLDMLQNKYLRNSYSPQLIAGISGSYLYNNQAVGTSANSAVLRINWESNGNLLYGVDRLVKAKQNSDGKYELFGTKYAQYVRADATLSQKFNLGEKSALVYRLYGGYGYNYGNSTDIPFDRLFYAGGINSMRGWTVRTLGPGSVAAPEKVLYPSQLGNMRLEANLELRFPMWDVVHGALFFDLGNIWYAGSGDFEEESIFRLNRFYRQLGFNTGYGIRLDFNIMVLRLDWGIKLHDPNQPAGERWIHNFRLSNTALNFGIGYPF